MRFKAILKRVKRRMIGFGRTAEALVPDRCAPVFSVMAIRDAVGRETVDTDAIRKAAERGYALIEHFDGRLIIELKLGGRPALVSFRYQPGPQALFLMYAIHVADPLDRDTVVVALKSL